MPATQFVEATTDFTKPANAKRRHLKVRKTKSNPDQGTFAWRLKNAREQMGMTIERLSREAGFNTSHRIEDWEKGRRHGRDLDHVINVARALDVSLDYLAGLSDELGCFPSPSHENDGSV